jgi:hypothetical protein
MAKTEPYPGADVTEEPSKLTSEHLHRLNGRAWIKRHHPAGKPTPRAINGCQEWNAGKTDQLNIDDPA